MGTPSNFSYIIPFEPLRSVLPKVLVSHLLASQKSLIQNTWSETADACITRRWQSIDILLHGNCNCDIKRDLTCQFHRDSLPHACHLTLVCVARIARQPHVIFIVYPTLLQHNSFYSVQHVT